MASAMLASAQPPAQAELATPASPTRNSGEADGVDGPKASRRDRESSVVRPIQDAGLDDYQLGDCLGKGAFGSVFRALNMGTGETVAVKQIRLADLPKSELRVITLEIDLLKNLDHPHIVKYHGFVKSAESLNIILEYCENGSLHSISKNFGKFPENLVGLYMSQVLHGLLYLHEQGVIHRDIKGANILTTKQGLVKLADFGVATRTTTLHESSVVGTPYWMAPEVIELSGATTASDVWSLGCTVIELLDGKPPYHKLQPMHALFRIVNDDHPPLPEGASPIVRDFLMQCFQKDHNLRVSARKLLKHPWIMNARRSDSVVTKTSTQYEVAVKSVQQWNEALKSPEGSLRKAARPSPSPVPPRKERPAPITTPARRALPMPKTRPIADQFRSPDGASDDNWDDDFASAISPSALQLPHLKPHDHFGGRLSADKLRNFASFEAVTEESNWDNHFEGDLTVKSPRQATQADPLRTVRASTTTKDDKATSQPSKAPLPRKKGLRRISGRSSSGGIPIRKRNVDIPAASRPQSEFWEDAVEDYSDLISANDGFFDRHANLNLRRQTSSGHLSQSNGLFGPGRVPSLTPMSGSLRRPTPAQRVDGMRRTRSSVEIQRYAENDQDEDYSDIFGKEHLRSDKPNSERGSDPGTLMLNSKLSNNSWLGDEDDEDDPFAQLEAGFDETDLEANVARDKYARLCTQVEALVGSLKTSQADDTLADIAEELLELLIDSPDMKTVIISSHGMLPMLEILETCKRRDILLNLLQIVNRIILDEVEIQENLCFVGGIPIITKFASRKYSSEIRLEAAAFVRQMCQTSVLTMQMLVSAGGLKVLVEFLEEDYEDERDLVMIGVNGLWGVFELQGPTPKNDFCRILARSSVLDPLSLVLSRVLDETGELAVIYEGRIANIFLLFSQAETHVKELVAERTVLHRVLKELKRMTPTHQITMLRFIKYLSMLSTTLDALQNANAIDVLTELLRSSIKEPHHREVANQVLNTIFNLCRLNKSRQEDAALNDIIPLLQRIYKTELPLKEFALPILCDMAHSGRVGRRELWRNKGLQFYISLLSDPCWQVTALDSIFIWLQEETARVEQQLLEGDFSPAIISCFSTAKANAFENLLEPLQKLLRLSPPVAARLAQPELFSRLLQKLTSNKALTRLNLLRVVQSICDASEEQGSLIIEYGLYDTVQRLAEADPAILVRDMAGKLLRSCDDHDPLLRSAGAGAGGRRRAVRRISSSTTPPNYISSNQSLPPTPTSSRSTHSMANRKEHGRLSMARTSQQPAPLPLRSSRDDTYPSSIAAPRTPIGIGGSLSVRSRLPRTTTGQSAANAARNSRLLQSSKKDDTVPSSPVLTSGSPAMVPNSRRRRQTSSEALRWP